MNEDFESNKNLNHKVDGLYKIWLGLVNLFRPFDELDRVIDKPAEIREIRQLLSEK